MKRDTYTIRVKVVQLPSRYRPITVLRYQIGNEFVSGSGTRHRQRLGGYEFLATMQSPRDMYDFTGGIKCALRKFADMHFGRENARIVANALWKQLQAGSFLDDPINIIDLITIKFHDYL